jgi:hypothetical protein
VEFGPDLLGSPGVIQTAENHKVKDAASLIQQNARKEEWKECTPANIDKLVWAYGSCDRLCVLRTD